MLPAEGVRLARCRFLCNILSMTYEVAFPFGFDTPGEACRGVLRRFSPEAAAVLLDMAGKGAFLLGDVTLLSPAFSLLLSEEERLALGRSEDEGGEGLSVFCCMTVPDEDPLGAGFDLARLVLVDTRTGRGLCVSRPPRPLVALRDGV